MRTALRSLLIFTAAILLFTTLTACGDGKWRNDVTMPDLSKALKEALPAGEGWVLLGDDAITASDWGANYTVLLEVGTKKAIWVSAESDMNIDEIGIIRVPDGGDVAQVKSVVETYLETKKLRMAPLLESYNQAELPKLDNASVTVCGQYLLYTVLSDGDTSAARTAFENALKAEN